jgi:large subunit ribosomal protein L24
MLMCSKCMAATRVTHKSLEDGKKIRACTKCGETIDS